MIDSYHFEPNDDDDDDISIATSEVLSENDVELLNSSDKEHIGKITEEITSKQQSRDTQNSKKEQSKSSTVNSKHTDLLDQIRQGKFYIFLIFHS